MLLVLLTRSKTKGLCECKCVILHKMAFSLPWPHYLLQDKKTIFVHIEDVVIMTDVSLNCASLVACTM